MASHSILVGVSDANGERLNLEQKGRHGRNAEVVLLCISVIIRFSNGTSEEPSRVPHSVTFREARECAGTLVGGCLCQVVG